MSSKWGSSQIRRAMRLYAVTDRAWLGARSLEQCVTEAIDGGATFIQLREKHAPRDEVVRLAHALRVLCKARGVPFVIDDDADIAREVGADGVHVGQSDAACAQVRALLGTDAIVGVSVQTVEQALAAQAAGADYLGVGAVVPTPTKLEAEHVSADELCAICTAVGIPVVAIGGLNMRTLACLAGSGVDGAAVVSAIFAADDCKAAAHQLREEIERVLT